MGAALLFVLAGGSAAYGLSERAPGPVLGTVAVGDLASNFSYDPTYGRLYVQTAASGVVLIDARRGIVQQPGWLKHLISAPEIGTRSNHIIDRSPDVFDRASGALLGQVSLPEIDVQGFFVDDPDEEVFYNYPDSATVTAVDMRTGAVVENVQACQSPVAPAVSAVGRRLFVTCEDGTTQMLDVHTGQRLRTLNTTPLGVTTCRPIADERTGRVLLLGDHGVGILDGHTGALLRTLPVQICPGGSIEVDPGTGQILVAPYAVSTIGSSREVLVLDGRSGAVLHRWATPPMPTDIRYNPLTGHLLITSVGPTDGRGDPLGDGSLSVLDAMHGTTLRRVALGIWPGAMFVEPTSKHLLVLNWARLADGTALQRSYADSWWSETLRRLKRALGWLPFAAPAPPSPPRSSTVTLLDLTKL